MTSTTNPEFARRLQSLFGEGGRGVPLVVGMTGHRRIYREDVPRLEEQVGRFFETLWNDWKAAHKNSAETPPVTVLCGLAEGADMLVAETVLALKAAGSKGMKINLAAVLPMWRDVYENDFAPQNALEDGAADRFRRLLAQADAVVELPTDSPLDKTRQYEKLGLYLAQNSFILLALCEELTDTVAKPGGSADVIAMKLNGVRADSTLDARLLDFNCVGPVFQLITRQTSSTPKNENNLFRWIVHEHRHPCDAETA